MTTQTTETIEPEIISYFFNPEKEPLVLIWENKEDLFENRKRHGFDLHQIAAPYFYQDNIDLFKFFVFFKSDNSIILCALWDYDKELFNFCVENKIEYFKLMNMYIEFVKNLSCIEFNLKTLSEPKLSK